MVSGDRSTQSAVELGELNLKDDQLCLISNHSSSKDTLCQTLLEPLLKRESHTSFAKRILHIAYKACQCFDILKRRLT